MVCCVCDEVIAVTDGIICKQMPDAHFICRKDLRSWLLAQPAEQLRKNRGGLRCPGRNEQSGVDASCTGPKFELEDMCDALDPATLFM